MVSTIGRNTWYLNSFTGVVIYINDVIMFYMYSNKIKRERIALLVIQSQTKQSDFDL